MVHPQASRPRTTFEPMQDRVAKGVHGRHAGHNENAYSFSLDELVKPRIKLTGQTYKLSNAKYNLIMAAELHASMELRAASRALLSTSASASSCSVSASRATSPPALLSSSRR